MKSTDTVGTVPICKLKNNFVGNYRTPQNSFLEHNIYLFHIHVFAYFRVIPFDRIILLKYFLIPPFSVFQEILSLSIYFITLTSCLQSFRFLFYETFCHTFTTHASKT